MQKHIINKLNQFVFILLFCLFSVAFSTSPFQQFIRIQLFACSLMRSCFTFFALFAIFFVISSTQILNPVVLRPKMFTATITGIPKVAIPSQSQTNSNGQLYMQKYEISMEKTSQQMLPQGFPKTQIYAYSALTTQGKVTQFPGPAIIAKQKVPIKVTWSNNIPGPHILPVDYEQPFDKMKNYSNQVPTVPHAHGIASKQSSDGEPLAFWTASGAKSPQYQTEEPCEKNQAVFTYNNEQDPGLYWYHDHTYGMTRLNVYAGLVGYYEIEDSDSIEENRMKQEFGQVEKRYFAIADRTFKTSGQLYYSDSAKSQYFTSWIPEFFGNTITVNGRVWPKVTLEGTKYRLIFLNGCQCRYLNIYFLNNDRKIPFQLIRVQGDYFPHPIVTYEYFLSLGARLQIMIDLTYIYGQVIMKNNAAAPHPDGQEEYLIDEFTGTIMKMQIKREKSFNFFHLRERQTYFPQFPLRENRKYPAFDEGQAVFAPLIELLDDDQQSMGMYIDGVSMQLSAKCEGSVFQVGKVYDLYVINLTPDTHPMHIHLVSVQKISSFSIDYELYAKDWYELNGGLPGKGGFKKPPKSLDPRPYRKGEIIEPKQYEKVFRDMLDAVPLAVTVMRIKLSHNDGSDFGFETRGSRYVWHCHMLEHEDNEMMKYFCLQ